MSYLLALFFSLAIQLIEVGYEYRAQFLPCLCFQNFVAVFLEAHVPNRWPILYFNNKSVCVKAE